jgi:hypothetical protein
MQTVYVGNTLINDVMLGSQRMDDVIQYKIPTGSLTTSGLVYYFDANTNADNTSWRTVQPYGNVTGALFQTNHTSAYPASFNLTGSIPDINFGATPTVLRDSNSTYTVLMTVKPTNDAAAANLTWWGDGRRSTLRLIGDVGGTKYMQIDTDTSSSIATNLPVSLNQWHQLGLTKTTNTTFASFNLWADTQKQAISGSTSLTDIINPFYWIIGTANSNVPLNGSVISYLVYNRVLSDTEIINNFYYFKSRTV